LSSRDYIVTRAEREATGKTSAEIIRERELNRRNSKSSNNDDSDRIEATPAAQKVLSGLAQTTPKYAQYADDATPPNYETVESKRQVNNVIVTENAARVFNSASEEQQAEMIRPDTNYEVLARGSNLGLSASYYQQPQKQAYVPEQLSRSAVLKAQINAQYKEKGYVDEEKKRPLPIPEAEFNEALRLDETSRARLRGAQRDFEAGKITRTQFNGVVRDIQLQERKYNQHQANLERQQLRAERREAAAAASFWQAEAAYQSKPKTQADRDFNTAYNLSKDYEKAEYAQGQKSRDYRDLFNLGTQLSNPLEMGYNYVTKGSPLLDYESRHFLGRFETTLFSGFAQFPVNMAFLGKKAVYEAGISYYSKKADFLGSLKNEYNEAPKPLLYQGERNKAFWETFNPTKPEGLATWAGIGISTALLGSQIANIRSSAAKAPNVFKQDYQGVVLTKTHTSEAYTPFGGMGVLKPVSATKVLNAFRGGNHIQINAGLDVNNAVGFIKYGKSGNYARSDFFDFQSGKTYSYITKSGLFGAEKRTTVIQTPLKNNMVSVATQTSRTRAIIGTQFSYKAKTYQTTLPKIQVVDYHSGQWTTGDYKIFKSNPLFKEGGQNSYSMFEYSITAKKVSANYFYDKSLFTKQFIDTKQTMNVYNDIFSRPTNTLLTNRQETLFNYGDLNADIFSLRNSRVVSTKATTPQMQIGKLNFPKDSTIFTGSESYNFITSANAGRADSLFFTDFFDKRLIRTVDTSIQQGGVTSYYTRSRIPDYFKAAKNDYLNLRYNTDYSLPKFTLPFGKKAGGTVLSSVFQLESKSGPSVLTIAPANPLIVPNLPIQALLPVEVVLKSNSLLTPLFVPLNQQAQRLQSTTATTPQKDSSSLLGLFSLPALKTTPIQSTGQINILQQLNIPMQSTQLSPVQRVISPQIMTQITNPQIVTTPITPSIFTPVITPPPPIGGEVPPFIPFLMPDAGGSTPKGKGQRARKYKPKYAPTLISYGLNLKAPKGFNPKTFVGTGLGIRPLF